MGCGSWNRMSCGGWGNNGAYWPVKYPVAVRLAGGSNETDATACKPDCHGRLQGFYNPPDA
jgi:hypothetical protein